MSAEEDQGVELKLVGASVLFLEPSIVPLKESGFAHLAIADEEEVELSHSHVLVRLNIVRSKRNRKIEKVRTIPLSRVGIHREFRLAIDEIGSSAIEY